MNGGRTCTNEAIPREILASHHGLQKEAILRVLRYPQVRDAWREKVSGQLDVHRYAISLLLLEDDVFHRGERWKRWEFLYKGDGIVNVRSPS